MTQTNGTSSYGGRGGHGGSSRGRFFKGSRGGHGGGGYNRPRDVPVEPPGPITVKRDFLSQVDKGIISSRPKPEVDKYLKSEMIQVQGKDAPKPVLSFDDLKWPDKIDRVFKKNNYTKPTPIQASGWPIALAGRDMVGIAQTGSGKTMGYAIPAFIHINGQAPERKGYGPMVLVLAPTRELAQQIEEVINQFNVVPSVCVFGGASKGPQIGKIQRGKPLIVVATPGRLNDFLESGIVSMANISYLVLDEADRMLDMGFEPQIKSIISQIKTPDRQTLMLSATWSREVQGMAKQFLNDYVHVTVGGDELHANHMIKQQVEVCGEYEKQAKMFSLLTDLVSKSPNGKIDKTIIFAKTKRNVDDLTRQMNQEGFHASCIHGDKSQAERDWVLKEFRGEKAQILVATDVAARGLDVDDIKVVINYDYPNSSEDYVHRIGRTGRRDKTGTAYTFFTRSNSGQARDLISVLNEASQNVPPELQKMSNMRAGKESRFGGRNGYRGGYGRGGGGGGGGGFKRRFDGGAGESYPSAPKANKVIKFE